MIRKIAMALLAACLATLVFALHPFFSVRAASAAPPSAQKPSPLQGIDESRRVTLRGNTRPEATAANDRGAVPENFALDHMFLQLKRSPEQEQALEAYIAQLHDHASPNFHQWLTPAEFGETYGLAESEIQVITRWLESHGIRVNLVYPNRMLIDISATAAQVREAFQVRIHYLDVKGVRHFANMNDPQIPAALAPFIAGIVSMHDFEPRPKMMPRSAFTASAGEYLVVPGDLAVIYNLNPLFSQGFSGQGQTIVVIEDTNVFSTTDWTTFRATFGLSQYTSGSFTQVHPGGCTNPRTNADDGEAILDAEYSSAAAPNAAIELASCANTATFGGLIALQNLLNSPPPPPIVSISYGDCEPNNGAAANAAYNSAYQQADSEGVSMFVSAGDEGAASCDADQAMSVNGISVSGFASTPYNVAVGGTDFEDSYLNENSTYWSSTNSSTFESAKFYVPEIPWNDSCASVLLASYLGDPTTYGSSGFCNTTTAQTDGLITTASGSGGPSGCATGTPSTTDVVSGTCAGYAKPAWQSGLVGNPNDGVRDLPDVSLFAANGVWGHYYVFCYSDRNRGGTPCTDSPSGWSGAGGTSFASPILAGIQALVNQKTASRQGNPNPVYYAIAKSEYGSSGNTNCNSSTQPILRRGLSTTCVFYDITQGDMDVNCTGSNNCYDPSGTNGVLNTSAITSLTVTSGGSGYTSAPGCSISAPDDSSAYAGYGGGVQATCTVTVSGGTVTGVTLTAAGAGYVTNPICTLTGGSGSGATCSATSAVSAGTGYQPAFPAAAGWDFATGIGTVNAYNLVFSPQW